MRRGGSKVIPASDRPLLVPVGLSSWFGSHHDRVQAFIALVSKGNLRVVHGNIQFIAAQHGGTGSGAMRVLDKPQGSDSRMHSLVRAVGLLDIDNDNEIGVQARLFIAMI